MRWTRGSSGRRLAVFYLATAVAFFVLLLWSQVVIPTALDFQLRSGAPRVISAVVFIGLAALIHLSGRLERELTGRDGHPRSAGEGIRSWGTSRTPFQ